MSALPSLFRCPAPWIVGVLNITPDSFSDGGMYAAPEAALAHARSMFEEGSHAVDVGGEATGPGTAPISSAEELGRVLPIVRELAQKRILSIDTYHARTARACLEHGAKIINDTSALRADPEMAAAVREHAAFVVLMFAKGENATPHAHYSPQQFGDVVADVADFLRRRADFALKNGIAEERIVVDPGMGRFLSNDAEHSWELLRRFDELCERVRPFPVMIGTSRKGFLGGSLAERDPLSQLTAVHAIERGAALIRTHCPGMAAEFLAAREKLRK